MGKRVWWFLATLAVAFVLGGCVTKSSHTEGDRQVVDQTQKAGEVMADKIEQAKSAIDAGNPEEAKSLLEIGARAGQDVIANMKQQSVVHGPPVDPKPYSAENSKAARDRSTKDHTAGNWVVPVAMGIASVLSVAATLLGVPYLAPIFPKLAGKVAVWAKAGTEIINTVRAKAEANGGSIDVKTVLEIAKDKNVSAGIEKLVTAHAHAHEEAMGHNLTSLETIKDADGDGIPDEEPAAAV